MARSLTPVSLPALAIGLALLCPAHGQAAPIEPEELRTETLPAAWNPHWIWVNDVSFSRMPDGRAYLIDGDSGRFLGMVSAGYSHTLLQMTPAGAEFAVPSTYYSRGSRGERTDVVTLYDKATLTPGEEVVIPPRRYIGAPFVGAMAATDDGRFSLIYNFTPEQSVTVVDLVARKVVGEFPTPGCGLIYPLGPRRFFMQCADSSLQAVSIAPDGRLTLGERTAKLFADGDPATEKPVRIAPDRWLLFTYSGEIHEVDGGGGQLKAGLAWRLTDAATSGWRIGGLQPAAFHTRTNRLFALMHRGGDGTHKDPGTEVWVYDARIGRRLERRKLAAPATSVAVSSDEQPLLFTVMAGVRDLVVYDAATGAKLRVVDQLGDALSYLQPAPLAEPTR
ncbi:MAG: amine dehydrogenase large subunit [Phenylobacterium sp.]|uniref:amine dehydrogenase large subunit n=1 Tax=Phenylobacterium sp. TaxID=1871053 RepID=UPI0027362D9E|nr:amine dehydrogenase large subunit [Phenylobacterium sp.]MDP3749562.1 amine dehydrogenase large subunit [Phenylobacterium sp.]